jgi:hypothetical protein
VLKLVVLAGLLVLGGLGVLVGMARPAERPLMAEKATAPTAHKAVPTAPVAQGDLSVEITEAELTEVLSQRLVGQPLGTTPFGPATLKRIDVQLDNGYVQASGDAQVAAATVPVELTASGTVRDGRAVITIDDLRAAGLTLPQSTRDSFQRTVQAQLDAEVERRQLRVTGWSIAGGKLVLTGSRR